MSLTESRKQMGFTQQEMAGYLGINRTQLAMYERGNRLLPYKVLGQLARMEYCLENETELAAIMVPLVAEDQVQAEKARTVYANNYTYMANQLHGRLVRMEERYRHSLRVLAFVACTRKLPLLQKEREVWLNLLEAKNRCRRLQCGPESQAKVSIRLRAYTLLLQETNQPSIFSPLK